MDIKEIVKKLVGPIVPQGCASRDGEAFKNLENMTTTVGSLIGEIEFVSRYKNSRESSVKKAGEHADQFLKGIAGEFSNIQGKYLVVYKDGRIFTESENEENNIPLTDAICSGELTLIRMSDGKKLNCEGHFIDLPKLKTV